MISQPLFPQIAELPVIEKPQRSKDASRVFDDEQIIDAAILHFQQTGFPYRSLSVHVCMQEINRLASTEPDKLLGTNAGYHVADTYHPHRFHSAAERMKSPFEAFTDPCLLRRALTLQLEASRGISEGYSTVLNLVSGTQACANFRPGFACHLYRAYCKLGDTVLDTSTGYGGRLVGFMASGVAGNYIGIDPNTQTHIGNLKMASDLSFAENVELYNLPAEDVSHDLVRERCDFAFTSPPYFAKEHYSDEPTQSYIRYPTAEEWRQGFLVPMLRLQYAALKPGSFSIINIADVNLRGQRYPLVQWTKDAGRFVGFEYVRTDAFSLAKGFGYGTGDVNAEPIIVFQKAA